MTHSKSAKLPPFRKFRLASPSSLNEDPLKRLSVVRLMSEVGSPLYCGDWLWELLSCGG